MKNKVTIIGAGLVGSLWALIMGKRGYDVQVFERRGDMRKAGYSGGRSINLALSDRGWKGIEKAGVADKIRETAIPMYGRMIHTEDGQQIYQAYGKEGQAIYSVSRGGLNEALLDLADKLPNVQFNFDHVCADYKIESDELLFDDMATGQRKSHATDLLFGTDGAYSAVRMSLMKRPGFDYQQSYLEHGYKELTIPPSADGGFQLEKNALHIWPRGSFMMIALPNPDGSFTCTLFLEFKGAVSFDSLDSDAAVMDFFNRYFADAVPMMPTLLEDFNTNPSSSLMTVRCKPWNYNKTLLIGDAAHAIVPFFGQGMNCGFEDCTILDSMIADTDNDWASIFEAFNSTRVKDGNAIADLALRNFVEMRDHVADPKFLLRKKIAASLQEKFPERFMDVYSMVTFSHLPYSEGWKELAKQDLLFAEILALPDAEAGVNSSAVLDIFNRYYA